MMLIDTQHILTLADALGAHRNLTHWRISYLLRGNGNFLARLSKGSTCTLKTYGSCVSWFSENWPDDLEWPESVPRPETSLRGVGEDAA